MRSGQSQRGRRSSGLLAWVSLAALAGLLFCVALALTRTGPRPIAPRSQVEQRGIQDVLSRGVGPVERVNVYSATLGQLRPSAPCGLPENISRSLLVAARFDTYNPCDPGTRLWVVEVWAEYPPWVFEPVRMLYTAAGDFIRSEGGP
jgi:hypothetical protein